MKHLELFSGIGGFRRAMDLLARDGVMPFESVGYSEIDTNAQRTYKAVYNPSPTEVEIGDIVAFTKKDEGFDDRMKSLGTVELLTGGFPCQTFSMMGQKAGFDDEDRGQMFFRILDIIDAKKPKYLLLENVKNLITHDHKNTYKRIEFELKERGYDVYPNVFNSADFGLPQKRQRVLIFATRSKLPLSFRSKYTPENVKDLFIKNMTALSIDTYISTLDILEKKVDRKYFLSEKIKPTILANGSANYISNSEINLNIARPLTASMHKMHRACQDNYYSQDWIDSNGKINPAKECSKEEIAKRDIRKLTPREAFMLQGFPAEFAEIAHCAGVSDGALYKQSGNAVSVNTIYAVLYYLVLNKAIK